MFVDFHVLCLRTSLEMMWCISRGLSSYCSFENKLIWTVWIQFSPIYTNMWIHIISFFYYFLLATPIFACTLWQQRINAQDP